MGKKTAGVLKFVGDIYGGNEMYISRRSKVLSEQYKAFKLLVGYEFRNQNKGFEALQGRLKVTLFYNSKHDGDNVQKGIFDGLQGIAYNNDRQIKDRHIVESKEIEPGFWLYINEIGEK